MTWGGGQPHTNTGDRAQRYEVTYQEDEESGTGPRKVFGWSETLSGARQMAGAIDLHPSMFHPQIWDRKDQKMVTLS